MSSDKAEPKVLRPADVFLSEHAKEATRPIWLVAEAEGASADKTPEPPLKNLTEAQRRWLSGVSFRGKPKKQATVPGAEGDIAGIALGVGTGQAGEPSGPSDLLVGQVAATAPGGAYHLDGAVTNPTLAAIAWGLGSYRFRRYKAAGEPPPRLAIPPSVDRQSVLNTVGAVWLGRDLINTPASDMGPAELEQAARDLARHHGATVRTIEGDDLLPQNFPMIHAVGRASPKAPRLVDLTWSRHGGNPNAPRVTLVGKGITFDTGGLDIKPASAMLLMKKDMGGAATALAAAHMIMGHGLDVRLRVLLPIAENSIAGDAFRPGDVLKSRSGRTIEIGNTDAEGRLVLADAITLADDEAPDWLFVFATLTGAARTALGPELPALFTDDDGLADALVRLSRDIGDPVWRLPLWPGYERNLESEVADMNNVWDAPFAGAIIAALFLKRFVAKARRFAHFDLYGWRPVVRPLGPRGGDPQTARAVFALLRSELTG